MHAPSLPSLNVGLLLQVLEPWLRAFGYLVWGREVRGKGGGMRKRVGPGHPGPRGAGAGRGLPQAASFPGLSAVSVL